MDVIRKEFRMKCVTCKNKKEIQEDMNDIRKKIGLSEILENQKQ